jgi:hypothetical protein
MSRRILSSQRTILCRHRLRAHDCCMVMLECFTRCGVQGFIRLEPHSPVLEIDCLSFPFGTCYAAIVVCLRAYKPGVVTVAALTPASWLA